MTNNEQIVREVMSIFFNTPDLVRVADLDQLETWFAWRYAQQRAPLKLDLEQLDPDTRAGQRLLYHLIDLIPPEADMVAGIPNGGTSWAFHLANMRSGLAHCVLCKKNGHFRLGHDMDPAGRTVVIFDDVISTATSACKGAQTVREAGGEVVKIITPFAYSSVLAEPVLQEHQLPLSSLATYDDLISSIPRRHPARVLLNCTWHPSQLRHTT